MSVAAAAPALELPVSPETRLSRAALAPHEVLLLAGTPIYRRELLPVDIEAKSTIEVDGRSWTVAEVRQRVDEVPLVICIFDA